MWNRRPSWGLLSSMSFSISEKYSLGPNCLGLKEHSHHISLESGIYIIGNTLREPIVGAAPEGSRHFAFSVVKKFIMPYPLGDQHDEILKVNVLPSMIISESSWYRHILSHSHVWADERCSLLSAAALS